MASNTRSRTKVTSTTPSASSAGPPIPGAILPGSLSPELNGYGNDLQGSQNSESASRDVNSTGHRSAPQGQAEQDALPAEVDARTFSPPLMKNSTRLAAYGMTNGHAQYTNQATPITNKVAANTAQYPASGIGSAEESANRSVEQAVRMQLMQNVLALMKMAESGDFVAPKSNFNFVNWVASAVDDNDLAREINIPRCVRRAKLESVTLATPNQEVREECVITQPNPKGPELRGEDREAIFSPREPNETGIAYHHRLRIQAGIMNKEGDIFAHGASALRAETKGKGKVSSSKEDANFGHYLAHQINVLKQTEENEQPKPSQNRVLPVDAKSMQRPRPSPDAMMSMTTYGEVNGVQALILFDSGSTCDSITPSLAAAAKVTTVLLDPPFTLQLGCVGARSKVNWGATHSLTLGDHTYPSVYTDVVNAAHYDMILGTTFMHAHGVRLDFKLGRIEIDGQSLSALTRAEADELKTPAWMPTAIDTGENILPEVMLSQTPPNDHQLITDIMSGKITMQHPSYNAQKPIVTLRDAERKDEQKRGASVRAFKRAASSKSLVFKASTAHNVEHVAGPSTSR